jgi:hypothetical protein
MKNRSNILAPLFFIFALVGISHTAQSQILISLLLGDKLNSPNLEFGIEGGFNRTWLSGIDEATGDGYLHLGFYFDIRIKNDLWLNTGLRVKSNTGAKSINAYPLNNTELDAVFQNGSVDRRIGYWYVPFHLKYRFGKNDQFFVNGGGQVGLRHRATDTFLNSFIDEDDVSYTLNIGDQIKRFDAGLSGGFGYKFKGTGMNLGLTYYHGLTNIMKTTDLEQYNYRSRNSSLYLYVNVPVGGRNKEGKN